MTARDRIVLIVVGFLAAAAAFWFLAVAPKRKDASDLSSQITSAQQRLDAAQASAATAQAAKKQYDTDYATVARLGKAVPVDDDMPSLVYQLQTVARASGLDFRSIKLTGGVGGGGSTPAASSASSSSTPASTVTAALPPGATVGPAGFPTMPFSFDFSGTYKDVQKFLRAVNGLTTVNGKSINVKGRLMTVDGVSLQASPKGFPHLDATIVATSYLLPADEGLTAGATANGPAGGTATPGNGSTATASLTTGNN